MMPKACRKATGFLILIAMFVLVTIRPSHAAKLASRPSRSRSMALLLLRNADATTAFIAVGPAHKTRSVVQRALPVMSSQKRSAHGLHLPNRRGALAGAFGAALALAAPLLANADARARYKSLFQGEYDDPDYPGCWRSIRVTKVRNAEVKALLEGVDNRCDLPVEINLWSLDATLSSNEQGESFINVDFSERGGQKEAVGKYDLAGPGREGIIFSDGSRWAKVKEDGRKNTGTPTRRPTNVRRCTNSQRRILGATTKPGAFWGAMCESSL